MRVLLTIYLSLLFVSFGYSQNSQMKRIDLYNKGNEALKSDHFTEAALNLFAFFEINKNYLLENDIQLYNEVKEALTFSKSKLISFKTFKPIPRTTSRGRIFVDGKTNDPEIESVIEFNGQEFIVDKLKLIEVVKSEDGGGF